MLLKKFIAMVLIDIADLNNGHVDIEFDIGVNPVKYKDDYCIEVFDESSNRLRFTITTNLKGQQR